MRIQVIISDDMVKKVDAYAERIGVSRSSLCATLIGQGIMGFDRAYQIVNDNLERITVAAGVEEPLT